MISIYGVVTLLQYDNHKLIFIGKCFNPMTLLHAHLVIWLSR